MTINATTDAVLVIDPLTKLYDINIDSQGDIQTEDFFDTSILYSLFGERRANSDEVVDARYRRGWIGSEGKDFENGSKLWLFSQARITATNLARIADEARKSLQWLVDDGFAVSINVADVSVDTKKNKLILTLDIGRSFDKVDRRFFDLWDNTGAQTPDHELSKSIFTPTDIEGLSLWLDASDTSTITEDGDLVVVWSDKSGDGNDAVRNTESQSPTTNANTIGGLNVLTFDGIDDFLLITTLGSSSINNMFLGGGSFFCVVNPLSDGEDGFGRIFDKQESFLFVENQIGDQMEFSHLQDFAPTIGVFKTTNRVVNAGVGNIITYLYDNSSDANRPVFRVDRVVDATNTTFPPSGTAKTDDGIALIIGNIADSSRSWDGYFGEIVFYNRTLSVNEIINVEDYLSKKWSIANQ